MCFSNLSAILYKVFEYTNFLMLINHTKLKTSQSLVNSSFINQSACVLTTHILHHCQDQQKTLYRNIKP